MPRFPRRLTPRRQVRILACGLVALASGCIHHDDVTMRPTWAYPQHLVSLCGGDSKLNVKNRGDIVTTNVTSDASKLLLSMQLVPGDPGEHRLYTAVHIDVSVVGGISVYAEDERGWSPLETISPTRIHCAESGELTVDYAADSYYFWASVGTRSHVLALWSNTQGDLVLQHRWSESVKGLVGGTVTSDGWALFPARPGPQGLGRAASVTALGTLSTAAANCADLTGDYLPTAERVHLDGSVGERTAVDQFFRAELIGEQPVNQGDRIGTKLRVKQDQQRGITLELYEGDELLGSRTLPAAAVSCNGGRWKFEGETAMESAWLLFAASAGVHWEDLTLWRDRRGALLVKGEFVRRALLLLIPFGGTEILFMAFPAFQE